MNKIVGEILIIGLMVSAAAVLAISLAPPVTKPECEVKIKDAPPAAATTHELFDILMISGEIHYGSLKIVIFNASSGSIVDVLTYNGSAMDGTNTYAPVSDVDALFSSGDLLRIKGALVSGLYEVVIVDGKFVVFDSLVNIK